MSVSAVSSTPSSQTALYFIDASLADLDTLLAGLPAGAEVVLLDPSQDGLTQMLAALDGRSGVDALHILTHGAPGQIQLGNAQLDASTLPAASSTLQALGQHLSADADILLYGCDVAASDEGQALIGQIAGLTGADVAASIDLTGASSLGGDWELEARSGAVETDVLQANDFTGVLAPTITNLSTFSFTEGGLAAPVDADITLTGGANYGDGYIQFEVTAGKDAGDQLKVAAGGNITLIGSKVYYSGTQIGTVDSFYNGTNGQALRINLINQTVSGTSPVVNGDFSNGLANWTAYTDHVNLGVTQIAGWTTPELAQSAYPSQTPGRDDNDLSDDYDNPIVTVVSGRLKLEESYMITPSYGVVHGPAAYSDAFAATTGMVLKFDWQANNINDDYHVVGYLLNTATGAASIALQSYGTSGAGTATVTVPTGGSYRFVFVSGTFDATGGTVAGASMFIDNIRVEQPFVTDAVITALARQVTYQSTSESPTAPTKTVTVSTKNSLNETTSGGATVNVTPVNDAPGITSHATPAVLAGINEDQSNDTNIGATVNSLFAPRFTDVDSGASLGGIVVVGDVSTGTQGKWQYSTNGTNWFDISSTAVSTSSGLVLSATTKLRFEPSDNWYGAPGALTVHLLDNSQGSYTSGGTRVVYNTVTDTASSPASSGAVNLGTTVASVNDLPYFTSAAGAASLKETAAYDDEYKSGEVELNTVANPTGALTGTLAGTDVEDGANVTFGIRGGTATTVEGVTTVTKAGFFGKLELNPTTKEWTYTPTNFTAINALGNAQTATDTFDFSITDTTGATAKQALTITYTGTNDLPVVKAGVDPIPNQDFNGNGSWSYQIPADIFTDAEGTNLTYTIQVVANADGTGAVLDTITGTMGGNVNLPSNWLIFNEASRTLSGTPTAVPGAKLPLNIKVTASDGSASVSDTFTVTLNPPASGTGTTSNVAPTSTNDRIVTAQGTDKFLVLTDFGTYKDAEGTALAKVKITTLPVKGELWYDSGSGFAKVTATGLEVTKAELDANKLKFVPATGESGSDYATIGFQVSDGTDYSAAAYSLAVDVTKTVAGSPDYAVAFAASDVTTAAASTWTKVYTSGPLSGFTETVRVVIDATGGGTIRLADATGVTAATGYGSLTDGTATSIAFEGTLTQVNAALLQLQANRGTNASVSLNMSAVKGGAAYNSDNGHYYQYVASPSITWTAANTAATDSTFNGLKGYLATITSDAENTFIMQKVGGNAWIGASDSALEGTWKWMGGPESGQTFFTYSTAPSNLGTSGTSPYYSWQINNPDNAGDEDYAQIITVNTGSLVAGKWNDLPTAGGTGDWLVTGYVIEYGGTFDGGGTVAEQASRTVTITGTAAPAIAIAGDAAYTENAAAQTLSPALSITDIDSTTLASATVTLSAGKVTGDVLALTNVPGTMGNIVGVYDADNGVLNLSSAGSTATLAQWETALKAVTFYSTSDTPGASRTVSWQVNDGTNSSNLGATTIAVTSVNDAPVATKLADVTVDTGADWSYDIDGEGNALFSDAENEGITYSAKYQKADGTWATVPASGTSYWLTFNTTTHTFSGNPPAGTPYLNLKVIGTDALGAAGETTFTLNLTTPAGGAAATNSTGSISISGTNTVGNTLTATAPTDADGYTGTVTYQWQMSSDAGATWVDIGGATGTTFVLTQAQSSKQVRAQAFYTDNGGFAEAPLSNVLSVPAKNITGTVTVNGSVTPGETLVAALSDPNGVVGITPTYTWYRGDTSGAQTTVVGGNFSSYTLTNDDGGKYITVKVTYTDNEGTAETVTDSTDGPIQLGAVPPKAVDDSGAATEASGEGNRTAGSNATGNVLTNDTDANSGDTKVVTSLRSGSSEGAGELAEELTADNYTVSGLYGSLTVNKDGSYTYTIYQDNAAVQALNTVGTGTLSDTFNYTVTDGTLKSDIGVLTVTVNGANDAITLANAPALFTATEDSKTSLVLPSDFVLRDPDTTGSVTVKLVASEGKLSGVTSGNVTVTGNDSGTLTLVGTLQDVNVWLRTADNVAYTTSPNDNGVGTSTITLKANDGVTGDVTLATVNVDVTATNDAPRLDLNANNNTAAGVDAPAATTAGADLTGNDHAVVFRPRGSAVQVVDDDVTITDIDGDTTLVKATVEITAGAWDNSRTIYETLSSTAGSAIGGIAITGNGTGANGLTGATKLTLTGTATHAQYQAVLKTIVYNNSNENAFAGNRSITIAVFDKETADGGLESNSAAFTTKEANGNVVVGQKIYIGGVDTGKTVATVIDSTHFVASGPLPTLANKVAMSFYLDGLEITTATAKAPLAAAGYAPAAATTTVQVLWTPVVDLNGNAASGVGYTTSYTEGSNGTYITSTDALITDQDGNLKTVTVTLNNAADTSGVNSTETLFMAAGIVSNLATNGITTTFYGASDNVLANGTAGVHKIVFNGNKDATTFQLGMREVQYKNTSENPSITPRTVTVNIVDQDNNTGVPASATINIIPVNDVPVKGGDYAGALNEGGVYVFTTTDLNSTDIDDDAGTLKYVLTSVPDAVTEGRLFRDSNNNNVVDAGEALVATADTSTVAKINAIDSNGYFTQSEVAAGQIKYAHSGKNPNDTNATGTDTFGFKLVDGMEDYAFNTIPADTVTLTITEVNDVATGVPVISGTMTPGQVLTASTATIADADGPASPTFAYQWMVNDGSGWANATGTGNTTANYTLGAADQGKQVKVVVTFNDALGRLNTLQDVASGTVAYTNTGSSGGVSITDDGTPQAGDILTANTSALADADGLGPVSYQWKVWDATGAGAWVNVPSATSKTYTLPPGTATGAKYQVVVSYTDGRGNAESVTSAEKVVVAPAADVNDAPLLTGTGSFGAAAVAPATTSLFSGVAVSTIEAGQKITTLTLTVSGLRNGVAEKLTVDGVALDLATTANTAITYAATPPAGTLGGVSYAITMAGTSPDVATVTLTRTDNLTETQAKALVEGLALSGGTTPGLRVVTLTSLVDDGGTDNSGHDTGTIGLSATVDVGDSLLADPSSNTKPTVTTGGVFNTATVAEGGVVTIANTLLAATDTEQPNGLQVVLASTPTHGTLFRDLNGNGLVDGTETALVSGNKFALADITAGRIKYLHDGSESGANGVFTFNVSDGLALSDTDAGTDGNQATIFNITVDAVNDAPTLTVTAARPDASPVGTPVAFTEGDVAKAMFTAANASAVDEDQNITELKLMVSGLRDGAAEKLVVDGTSIALTHNLVSANTATSGIAYTVSVTGGTATVTLTKADTAANWNAFINGLSYENTSQNPTAGQRSVTLTKLTDSGADHNTSALELTSVVAVTPVNDAPTLSTTGITVIEGGSLTLTTSGVVAVEVDNALSTLTYTLSTAPGQGTLYIDTNGNAVNDDGTTLAVNGTFTHAQLAAGQVRYAHNGSESGDTFALTVKDPGNATSAAQSITVTRTPTNDAPTITLLGTDVLSYAANSGARTLEQEGNAVVDDADLPTHFGGGSLRVAISFNRDPAHDVLSIQSGGPSGITVSGNTVSYAGTPIGTFTGGTGTADLVVTFNAAATPAAVTALVKAIQFSNDQDTPALTSRSVSFTLNDGNTNGEAAPVSVAVNLLSGVTPGISIGSDFFVTENTQAVTTLSATSGGYAPVTFSIDTTDSAANIDRAKFEIVSGNILRLKTAPNYESPDDDGADRTYNVVVKATNALGSTATRAMTVTVLNQDPEEGIVPGDTSGPAFGYATVNGSSLVMTYTDASNLDATNLPPTSAFTVSGNTVTAVAVNATAKTVTLTLGTAVVAGAAVTVAYADPTGGNDIAALQDAAGNDASTMPATSVTNITPSSGGGGSGGGSSGGSSGGGSTGGGSTGGGSTGGGTTPIPGIPSRDDWTNLPDNDGDGLPELVEDFVPQPYVPGAVIGDGNGDGVKDSTQDDVASSPFLLTPTAVSNPGQAPNAFVTLVADSVGGKTDTSDGNRAQIRAIEQLDAASSKPGTMTMPLGMLSFVADVQNANELETFSLYVDPALGVNGYWMQNTSGTWVNLASPVYGGQMVMEGGRLRIDFQLRDGGVFDADGRADGVITAPGTVAFMPLSIVGTQPDTGENDFWF